MFVVPALMMQRGAVPLGSFESLPVDVLEDGLYTTCGGRRKKERNQDVIPLAKLVKPNRPMRIRRIRRVISSLPKPERVVINMIYDQKMKPFEVMLKMGFSQEELNLVLKGARDTLKSSLQNL